MNFLNLLFWSLSQVSVNPILLTDLAYRFFFFFFFLKQIVKIILNSLNSVNFHINGYLWQWDYKFTKDTNGKVYFLEQISINTNFELKQC